MQTAVVVSRAKNLISGYPTQAERLSGSLCAALLPQSRRSLLELPYWRHSDRISGFTGTSGSKAAAATVNSIDMKAEHRPPLRT